MENIRKIFLTRTIPDMLCDIYSMPEIKFVFDDKTLNEFVNYLDKDDNDSYTNGLKSINYLAKNSKDAREGVDDTYIYVISICFVQEPEYGENDSSNSVISQYPLEDICDKFKCYCSDYYEKENTDNKELSYVEFASDNINNIKKLKSIIGKHVYNLKDNDTIKLVIE